MRRDYRYTTHRLSGIPLIQIDDPPYFAEDLYELLGSRDFVVTFVFVEGSRPHAQYGRSITGRIFYPKGTRKAIEHCITEKREYGDQMVRIDVALPRLKLDLLADLKHNGIPVSDIQSVSSVPYKRETRTEAGVKTVPNLIRIPVSLSDFRGDPDVLLQNLQIRRLQDGYELIPEEASELVASILAIGNDTIEPALLAKLGYTPESAGSDPRIRYHYYHVKKKRGTISTAQLEQLAQCEADDWLGKLALLTRELTLGHEPNEPISPSE